MPPQASSKTMPAKGVQVAVGNRVARYFSSHELDGGMRPQWIQGQVCAFKLSGRGKSSTTWWTLAFEPPAVKPLCCNTEEVVLMLHAANEFRLKRHALEKQLGTKFVVTWSQEDKDLSMSDWDNDLSDWDNDLSDWSQEDKDLSMSDWVVPQARP